MKRVEYSQLIGTLNLAGCKCAISQLKEMSLTEDEIIAIELDATVEDANTKHECVHINEFNIYTKRDIVLFGIELKHENDFNVQWARTKPQPTEENNAQIHN